MKRIDKLEQKQQEAIQRQTQHDLLTLDEKIEKCIKRGGEGKKEYQRLMKQKLAA